MSECKHEHTISFGGKCSDLFDLTWPDGTGYDGYVPYDLGIGGGDYIQVTVCVDCHRVIGMPSPDKIREVQQAIAEERRDDGYEVEDPKW